MGKMSGYGRLVAIDPDTVGSGVAVFGRDCTEAEAGTKTFAEAVGLLHRMAGDGVRTRVIIEAGYLNKKANWHGSVNVFAASRIGENVGRNHQTARLLVEMSRAFGLETIEAKPLVKRWKGRDGKITSRELNGLLVSSGFKPLGRTNQDVRDAVLLGLVYISHGIT